MPEKRSPGWRKAYDKARARRQRIERYVLNHFKAARPDEYDAAWADGETQENQRRAET